MKKIFIIAGEASGDLHGSNLCKELLRIDPNLQLKGWGGPLMEAEGVEILKDYKELAFMGFWEVLKNIRTISKNFKLCRSHIDDFNPDAVIFIDYPGFNLRMAKYIKEKGIQTHYYISPQVWAWKKSRVKKIKALIDKMYVILPFEKPFYQEYDYPVEFVGHPLIDAIDNFKKQQSSDFKEDWFDPSKKVIAVLPGSRKQEINTKLPIMLSVIEQYPDYQFVIAGAPGQDISIYEPYLGNKRVNIIFGKTYDLLQKSHAALVTSGTATLETALFKVPQVVCYKSSALSYHIAKRIVTIKYISLVNLIMDNEVVKELIQNDLNTKNLTKELSVILSEEGRNNMLQSYNELEVKCGGIGASKNVAVKICEAL